MRTLTASLAVFALATPLLAAPGATKGRRPAAEGPLTCDKEEIEPRSYRLATEVQSRIVLGQDYDWWDAFALGKHEEALGDLNDSATRAAEKALDFDPRNQMAHGVLARQYVVAEDAEAAEPVWDRLMAAGAPVVWTGILYDVDARTYFVLAFDRQAISVYQFEALAGAVERHHGIPEFPGPSNDRFWRAMGGCLDPAVRPEATIPWSDVREIKAGNFVLWFKLSRPVTIAGDRKDKAKSLKEIKVCLLGRTGTIEYYKPVGGEGVATRGVGPAGYQDMIRRTLVRYVDPDHHIVLPKLSPGAGW